MVLDSESLTKLRVEVGLLSNSVNIFQISMVSVMVASGRDGNHDTALEI